MNRRDKNNLVRRQRLQNENNKRVILARIKKVFYVILFVCIILYGFRWYFYHKLLNGFGEQTSGVIINEKNWWGKKRYPKSRTFTYSYKFTVDGNVYKEDSKQNKHEIGEKVEVEYLDFYPSISRIKD